MTAAPHHHHAQSAAQAPATRCCHLRDQSNGTYPCAHTRLVSLTSVHKPGYSGRKEKLLHGLCGHIPISAVYATEWADQPPTVHACQQLPHTRQHPPTAWLSNELCSATSCLDSPMSDSFTRPPSVMSTLCGFRSARGDCNMPSASTTPHCAVTQGARFHNPVCTSRPIRLHKRLDDCHGLVSAQGAWVPSSLTGRKTTEVQGRTSVHDAAFMQCGQAAHHLQHQLQAPGGGATARGVQAQTTALHVTASQLKLNQAGCTAAGLVFEQYANCCRMPSFCLSH